MKVRELLEALAQEDPERTVVVPWSIPGTARECVGVKEVDMKLADKDDYVKLNEAGRPGGRARVLALLPAHREADDKPEPPKGDRR